MVGRQNIIQFIYGWVIFHKQEYKQKPLYNVVTIIYVNTLNTMWVNFTLKWHVIKISWCWRTTIFTGQIGLQTPGYILTGE